MLRHARVIRLNGVVQGVGFRPFAYRLARRLELGGWVKNGGDGVEIYVEGPASALDAFARALLTETPPAASVATAETLSVACEGVATFAIRESEPARRPSVRISPDLPTCADCLRELFDPADRRYRYPYINCTQCGPRYSIVRGLPYDRPLTTMAAWPMCADCRREYDDPGDRRFHAQPVACAACGPTYVFEDAAAPNSVSARGYAAIEHAAQRLRDGAIVALKGIGGYHLACDPANERAVAALRERKFRRERPFALMARDAATARTLIVVDDAVAALLGSTARPIVLGEARVHFSGVSPQNRELGVMLPYAPLHELLFAAGAPPALVMTSANRASEPLAFEDDDARAQLRGIADAMLIGERPIARRLDDSIVRVAAGIGAPAILRRARGYAPAGVANVPNARPMLALGGDLKNSLALAVGGVVFASQHVGDLEHRSAFEAFRHTAYDLCATYELNLEDVLVAHDAHPEYASTAFALEVGAKRVAVQHHRAHVAGVLAERGAWATEVTGVAFDGTGYGDDGTIWGGEVLTGSVARGFARSAHLRPVRIAGGDAAARFPAQAAAGFLAALDAVPDLSRAPFSLGPRYAAARELGRRDVRCFTTTSVGRLFDTVAALLGFTGPASFEGQAAMWLEHAAWSGTVAPEYPFPLREAELDFRPLLSAIVEERAAGRPARDIARGFHRAVADAVVAVAATAEAQRPIVCSGGVFQNALLVELVRERLGERAWFNSVVPANDGGLALGQVALAAFAGG